MVVCLKDLLPLERSRGLILRDLYYLTLRCLGLMPLSIVQFVRPATLYLTFSFNKLYHFWFRFLDILSFLNPFNQLS